MGEQHPVRVAVGRNSLNVRDLGCRFVRDGPPVLSEAAAEVDVLQVHEVGRVEAADGVPRLPPGQEAGARDPVHLSPSGVVPIGHPVPARERVPGPELAHYGVTERLHHVREASRGRVEGTTGIDNTRADDGHPGVGFEEPPERRHRTRFKHHVRVGHQEVGAVDLGRTDVGAGAVTQVPARGHPPRGRVMLGQGLR